MGLAAKEIRIATYKSEDNFEVSGTQCFIATYKSEDNFEVSGTQCFINSKKFTIINLYKQPKSNVDSFLHLLSCLLDELFMPDQIFFICGDFNIDLKTISNEQQTFINLPHLAFL
ncbi:hypothetical protein QE152_g8921 [Popillia japonica]|uniref:Uncharacterized protein n=1 Tax=Popillia japonica TaxID=7064 RepID=A0AAW1M0J5_POPJA